MEQRREAEHLQHLLQRKQAVVEVIDHSEVKTMKPTAASQAYQLRGGA